MQQNKTNKSMKTAVNNMEWISVEDRLPENGKYLVFDDEYEIAYFKGNRFVVIYPTGIDKGPYTECHFRQELKPTYWMPLPELPKNK
jgi:hypothetical protein